MREMLRETNFSEVYAHFIGIFFRTFLGIFLQVYECLVWLYAAGTTVTYGAPTGVTHRHPTKNNTTTEHTEYDNPNTG